MNSGTDIYLHTISLEHENIIKIDDSLGYWSFIFGQQEQPTGA